MQRRQAGPQSQSKGSQLLARAFRDKQARLLRIASRLAAASTGDVHDARVAARRLRSMIATFRPMLDADPARRARQDLREIARALSAVREADVRRELLRRLMRADLSIGRSGAARLDVSLARSRAQARVALRGRIAGPAWSERIARLGAAPLAQSLAMRPDADLGKVLKLVDQPWRKARKLLARAPESAEDLHRLRLALKHCRYALEVVGSVCPEQSQHVLRHMRSVQDGLGDHRDVVQAVEWTAAHEESLGKPLAAAVIRRLRLREQALRTVIDAEARSVWPAYAEWRGATRALRKGMERTRDRA